MGERPELKRWLAHGLAWAPAATCEDQETSQNLYEEALCGLRDDAWLERIEYMRAVIGFGNKDAVQALLKRYPEYMADGRPLHRHQTATIRHLSSFLLDDYSRIYMARRDMMVMDFLKAHSYSAHVADTLKELKESDRILFLRDCGVGDEIRFTSVYQNLIDQFPNASFTIDKRLASIMGRSFPDTTFVPMTPLTKDQITPDHEPALIALPSRNLMHFLDGPTWKKAQNYDALAPVICQLPDIFGSKKAYRDHNPVPLSIDLDRISYWRKKVHAEFGDTTLVGLNWSSGRTLYRRMPNYLSPDELGPLFGGLENVVFINLQYTDATQDIAVISDLHGVQIQHFDDLDLRDDFENVGALMLALDLVVGVNTAVIEFSASLGVDTLFCVFRAENQWRACREQNRDAYWPSMSLLMPSPTSKTIKKDVLLQANAAIKECAIQKVYIKGK